MQIFLERGAAGPRILFSPRCDAFSPADRAMLHTAKKKNNFGGRNTMNAPPLYWVSRDRRDASMHGLRTAPFCDKKISALVVHVHARTLWRTERTETFSQNISQYKNGCFCSGENLSCVAILRACFAVELPVCSCLRKTTSQIR